MKLELNQRLVDLLSRFPEIVNLYEERSSRFVTALKSWLTEAESTLGSYQKPQVARLAALRATLLAAERGTIREELKFSKRAGRRKIADSVAVLELDRAQSILSEMQEILSGEVNEARQILKQLLATAGQRGLLSDHLNDSGDLQTRLTGLWRALAADPELGGGIQQVLIHVSMVEGLALLKEIVEEWQADFAQVASSMPS